MKILSYSFLLLLLTHFSEAQVPGAELTVFDTDIKIIGGNKISNYYYELQINNRGGEEYTHISIPFSKTVKISKLKAYITNSKGSVIRKLKKNEIIERSAISNSSLYTDSYVKEFSLKHNQYPYKIIYAYETIENQFIHIAHWSPAIALDVPTHNAILTVSIPENYIINFRNQDIPEPLINVSESGISYCWKVVYEASLEKEKYSPPLRSILPQVLVVPEQFEYEINASQKTWVEFGNWQYELLQGKNDLPDQEKEKISSLIENVSDELQKIKVLYHYLQDETRYINVSIETGGMVPYPASYVAENRYGDCKALTNYFMSVLEYAGISSFYTLIYSDPILPDIDADFPSSQFNHVILYVPREGNELWLDCTLNGPFNYLHSSIQNRKALIIDKDASRIMHTPILEPQDVLESRNIEVLLTVDTSSEIEFREKYKGPNYEYLSALCRNTTESYTRKKLEDYLLYNGHELIRYEIDEPHRDSAVFTISYAVTATDIYEKYGSNILVKNISLSLLSLEKPASRKLPLQINSPRYRIDTIIYPLPSGYKIDDQPVNISFSEKYGKYSLKFERSDQSITVVKSLLIYAGIYQNEEYEEIYRFMKKVRNIERSTLFTLSR